MKRGKGSVGKWMGWVCGVLLLASPTTARLAQGSTMNSQLDMDSLWSVGAQLGAGLLSDGGGSHLGFGVIANRKLNPYWMAGGFFNYIGRGSIEVGTASADANLKFFGGELNYLFADMVPGLQVGGKVGLGVASQSIGSVSSSSTDLYFGPKLAYDYGLGGGLSLGGEGNILFTTADDTSTATQILAALKLWF
jgi:hypothetical protein